MKKRIFLTAAIVWALFILYFSLIPPKMPYVPEMSGFFSDKLQHFVAFGALAFFLLASGHFLKQRIPVIFSSVYSLSIEVIQYFIPYRAFELLDFVAGVGGVVSASIVVAYVYVPITNSLNSFDWQKLLQKKKG